MNKHFTSSAYLRSMLICSVMVMPFSEGSSCSSDVPVGANTNLRAGRKICGIAALDHRWVLGCRGHLTGIVTHQVRPATSAEHCSRPENSQRESDEEKKPSSDRNPQTSSFLRSTSSSRAWSPMMACLRYGTVFGKKWKVNNPTNLQFGHLGCQYDGIHPCLWCLICCKGRCCI